MIIDFKIKRTKEISLNFDEMVFKTICDQAGGKEKIGYIFFEKIKDTNEYIINQISPPNKKDISRLDFCKISRRHKKEVDNWLSRRKHIATYGYYHTHPEFFGTKKSKMDEIAFRNSSLEEELSVFIIAVKESLKIYIYSFGSEVKEEEWKY